MVLQKLLRKTLLLLLGVASSCLLLMGVLAYHYQNHAIEIIIPVIGVALILILGSDIVYDADDSFKTRTFEAPLESTLEPHIRRHTECRRVD